MRRGRGLSVGTLVRAPVEELWWLTQDHALHPRWDLRLSAVVPERPDGKGAGRFRSERALPGHVIRGTGVAAGERDRPDGPRGASTGCASGAETGVPPERWPLASVLLTQRRGRSRAGRCRTRPPGRDALAGRPESLDALAAP